LGNKGRIGRTGFFLILVSALLIICLFILFQAYRNVYSPNTTIPGNDPFYLFIPTGSGIGEVRDLLAESGVIRNMETFDWVSEKKNYPNHVRPGRYRIRNEMNNNDLENMLRSGAQEPVQLIFTSVRTLEKLCGIVADQIEADSLEILNLLNDETYIAQFGFDKYTVRGMFIPNTYEVYWNSNADQFLRRMEREYRHFWTEERKRKAEALGLTTHEVSALASIIDEETNKNDEKPAITGVYLNRLTRGIPLQACPTLRFATGDYSIRRVLHEHMQIESPFNTYKYRGLPPGPINIPSIAGIDAVLNAEKHDYFYFSAREDMSGYHYFSKTLAEHNRYARLYQQVLDQQRVYK
jgi:UPF0755 protein